MPSLTCCLCAHPFARRVRPFNLRCFHYNEAVQGSDKAPSGYCYRKQCPPFKYKFGPWTEFGPKCSEKSYAEKLLKNRERRTRELICDAAPGCDCSGIKTPVIEYNDNSECCQIPFEYSEWGLWEPDCAKEQTRKRKQVALPAPRRTAFAAPVPPHPTVQCICHLTRATSAAQHAAAPTARADD